MAKFGCLLIGVAMVALFLVVVLPVLPVFEDTEFFDDMFAPLLCPNGEISREQYQTYDSDGTGYSMNVYCEDSEGREEDITGLWILIGIASFVIPFLIGLFMLIGGINRSVRSAMPKLNVQGTYPTGTTPNEMLNWMDSSSQGLGQSSGGASMTERLRELEESRAQGLINEEEYQAMRRKILEES